MPATGLTPDFRTRQEAQWAAFLGALGLPYEYRPRAFTIGHFRLTPTFHVPRLRLWLSVMACPTDDDLRRLEEVASETKESVFLSWGPVESPAVGNGIYLAGYEWRTRPYAGLFGDYVFAWAECPRCHRVDVSLLGRADKMRCNCFRKKRYGDEEPRLLAAFAQAAGINAPTRTNMDKD